jgi:hypothetical protein
MGESCGMSGGEMNAYRLLVRKPVERDHQEEQNQD